MAVLDVKKVLLTGGTGFVGAGLYKVLCQKDDIELTLAGRRVLVGATCKQYSVGEIGAATDWRSCLAGQQVVIHAAAQADGFINQGAADWSKKCHEVNVLGTAELARQAADAGVRRFIFLSSVKVNGEETTNGRLFSELDTPSPSTPYAVSKFEAEQMLAEIARGSGMELVLIRPSVVYGNGVRGTFGLLLRLIELGIPLPFNSIQNKRSMISLENLVDLICTCIDHPKAGNEVFMASDGFDLSTSDLVRQLAAARGSRARLVSFPSVMIQYIGFVLGQQAVTRRVTSSLQLDITKARNLLGWTPPLTLEEGFKKGFGRGYF